MTTLIQEDYKDGYYHFSKDLHDYPDCWCYVVWSARGPGKTYSLLRYYTGQGLPFIYMKRTKDDIDIICMDSDTANLSPYKDIIPQMNMLFVPPSLPTVRILQPVPQ